MTSSSPILFPMFMKLTGRSCLVVGAGKVGEPKIAGLLDTGAHIKVIAIEAGAQVQQWAAAGKIELELRPFVPEDLDGIFLVVVATASRDLNDLVFHAAESRGVLCNVVDVPESCDFFYPAVVRRGDLQIAISTTGQSPALAKHIRRHLEQQYGPGYAEWVAELGATRKLVLASNLDRARKLDLLHSFASRAAVEAALRESVSTRKGTGV